MKHYIEVPFQISLLFWDIFWEGEYLSFKDRCTIEDYKKHYIKLLVAYKKAIKDNILIADDDFLLEINNDIDKFIKEIKKSNNIESLNSNLISFLVNFSFLLLWDKPKNFNFNFYWAKTKTWKSNWKLDKYRSIQYVQTETQKKNTRNIISQKL